MYRLRQLYEMNFLNLISPWFDNIVLQYIFANDRLIRLNKFVSRITVDFCNLFYYYYPNTDLHVNDGAHTDLQWTESSHAHLHCSYMDNVSYLVPWDVALYSWPSSAHGRPPFRPPLVHGRSLGKMEEWVPMSLLTSHGVWNGGKHSANSRGNDSFTHKNAGK